MAQSYADEILKTHVIYYVSAIGDSFLLMQNNTWPYTDCLAENFLEAETIQYMKWPACSPDINPIDNVAIADGLLLFSKAWRLPVKCGTGCPKVSS
ncbi:hypothetical protein TNCV_4491091 [Trichonephila clavipes]|nr:hypothetical protein TNCV_4491091 [Trichonephila clavipes]